jgi:hypothetical protein
MQPSEQIMDSYQWTTPIVGTLSQRLNSPFIKELVDSFPK